MRAVLGETFALLGTHLNLLTLLALTVWLPSSVFLNYLEFFEKAEPAGARPLRVALLIQVVFDPLVVSATLCALGRIKQGLPVDYWVTLQEGMAAWGRLLVVRFLINCMVLLPGAAALTLGRTGAGKLGAGALLFVLSVVVLLFLLRWAVVEPVVVLSGGNAINAWGRAAALTVGRRWQIFWTMLVLFVLVLSLALAATQAFRTVPALNHFVVRVLTDCVLAVMRSTLTIALFLFYWRARPALSETA